MARFTSCQRAMSSARLRAAPFARCVKSCGRCGRGRRVALVPTQPRSRDKAAPGWFPNHRRAVPWTEVSPDGTAAPGELEQLGLAYFNEVERGGHFAAWEEPELFATELRAAFSSLR